MFNPVYGKTLSTEYSGFYNKGTDVTLADGKLSGYTKADIWTVGVNEDGTYTFQFTDKGAEAWCFGDDVSFDLVTEKIPYTVNFYADGQLINHTKIGMAMRAVSKDFETARLMGIKINNVISMTFVIGSALAVVGSILY